MVMMNKEGKKDKLITKLESVWMWQSREITCKVTAHHYESAAAT